MSLDRTLPERLGPNTPETVIYNILAHLEEQDLKNIKSISKFLNDFYHKKVSHSLYNRGLNFIEWQATEQAKFESVIENLIKGRQYPLSGFVVDYARSLIYHEYTLLRNLQIKEIFLDWSYPLLVGAGAYCFYYFENWEIPDVASCQNYWIQMADNLWRAVGDYHLFSIGLLAKESYEYISAKYTTEYQQAKNFLNTNILYPRDKILEALENELLTSGANQPITKLFLALIKNAALEENVSNNKLFNGMKAAVNDLKQLLADVSKHFEENKSEFIAKGTLSPTNLNQLNEIAKTNTYSNVIHFWSSANKKYPLLPQSKEFLPQDEESKGNKLNMKKNN